jgi:branched-chain amino acid transport system permease protein
MNSTIALFLLQDGIINGAIYALLGVTLVLLFTVTRIIFIPQGEFVAFGALTLATLEAGTVPGTAWLLLWLGIAAAGVDILRERRRLSLTYVCRRLAIDIAAPLALLFMILWLSRLKLGLPVDVALTLAVMVPLGPLVYRLAFQPLADASVLVLFIAAIGVHFAMIGLGLAFFGAEGFSTTAFWEGAFKLGVLRITGQSVCVLVAAALLLPSLYLFFEHTRLGKAFRATAINRLGARLVGIPVRTTGRYAFALAAAIGTVSGLLIGPMTTVYYDSGFLIGLKGFVAAIFGGLVSYPLTAFAAILIGVFESYSTFFASAFKEVIVFSLIIPVLLWLSLAGVSTEEEE